MVIIMPNKTTQVRDTLYLPWSAELDEMFSLLPPDGEEMFLSICLRCFVNEVISPRSVSRSTLDQYINSKQCKPQWFLLQRVDPGDEYNDAQYVLYPSFTNIIDVRCFRADSHDNK